VATGQTVVGAGFSRPVTTPVRHRQGRLKPAPTYALFLSIIAVAAISVPAASQTTAPQRIVSLVPALTQMLFAIGAGPRVVGVSSFDAFPPEVTALPRVGALLDPDMERILSLRPDLVITYGSQSDLQQQLTRAGIPQYAYRHAGLEGIFGALDGLGKAVGRPQEAQRIAGEIRARLDAIRARVRGRMRPRTLLVFERDPGALRGIYVSGGRGFLHEMLVIAGGTNVFADVDREAVQPSIETLISRAPEVIIEVRATGLIPAGNIPRERTAWQTLAAVPAVRTQRLYFLQGEHLVVPGPRVGEGTEALARALHPDAFR
jgi:iron complex transport system substrate-binding protein